MSPFRCCWQMPPAHSPLPPPTPVGRGREPKSSAWRRFWSATRPCFHILLNSHLALSAADMPSLADLPLVPVRWCGERRNSGLPHRFCANTFIFVSHGNLNSVFPIQGFLSHRPRFPPAHRGGSKSRYMCYFRSPSSVRQFIVGGENRPVRQGAVGWRDFATTEKPAFPLPVPPNNQPVKIRAIAQQQDITIALHGGNRPAPKMAIYGGRRRAVRQEEVREFRVNATEPPGRSAVANHSGKPASGERMLGKNVPRFIASIYPRILIASAS